MYILGNEEAVGLHSRGLEKFRGGGEKLRINNKNNKNQSINNVKACYIMSALKTWGKIVKPGKSYSAEAGPSSLSPLFLIHL